MKTPTGGPRTPASSCHPGVLTQDSRCPGPCRGSVGGILVPQMGIACSCLQSLSQLNLRLVLRKGPRGAYCAHLTGEEMGLREATSGLKSLSWPSRPVSDPPVRAWWSLSSGCRGLGSRGSGVVGQG